MSIYQKPIKQTRFYQNLRKFIKAYQIKNLKIQKLNESQSTEGAIPVNRVVEMSRGYTEGYMNSLMRGAEYRK